MLPSFQYPLSILEGHVTGRVFADREDEPTLVLVWETLGNVFLAGTPSPDANLNLSLLFNDTIIPAGANRKGVMFDVSFWPAEWQSLLPGMISLRPLIPDRRLLYTMDLPLSAGNAGVSLPTGVDGADDADGTHNADNADDAGRPPNTNTAGTMLETLEALARPPVACTLREVDADLLLTGAYRNAEYLRAEIDKQWPKPEDFLEKGSGYCVLQGDAITSWCLTEYPTDSACSIGVETVWQYQRKGHATAASAACLRKCVERGIKPYWDCYASNDGSRFLAEKLGLIQVADYPVYFLWYDKVDHLLVMARVASLEGRHEEAVIHYEEAFSLAAEADLSLSVLFGNPESRAFQFAAAARRCASGARLDLAATYLARAGDEGMDAGKVSAIAREIGVSM